MRKKAASQLRSTDSGVVQFLSEFAHYLIAAGTSNARFESLARIAFFKAASESAILRNQRINQSAIAAMTGLTRVQVRALSRQEDGTHKAKQDRIDTILEGWTTDEQFVRADFSPRRLTIGGRTSSFGELVRKYGGDVTPRSMLQELLRNGYVSQQGRFLKLDPKASETRAQVRLRQISGSLAALLRRAGKPVNTQSPLRSLNFEVEYPATSAKGRILLQRRLAERLRSLLAELQISGVAASLESPPSAASKGKSTRARLVLISEELDAEDALAR